MLAVYMPPQCPGRECAVRSISQQFLVAMILPAGVRAHGFEHGDDVELTASVMQPGRIVPP